MGGIVTTLFQRPDDPQFNLTTLLLPGNARPDGAQNNTFLDSSTNNFSITRNPTSGPNAPTQGTFSPFSQTGWSVNFASGQSNYIQTPATVPSITGDYTAEAWVYLTSLPNLAVIFSLNGSEFELWVTTSNTIVYYTGAANRITTTLTVPLNQWTHVALVRSSGVAKVYINGVADSNTYSSSATIGSGTAFLYLGRDPGVSGGLNGYISNVRLAVGAAVYTSNFTPPITNLGATTGGQNPPTGTQTYLLTCQSNRFVDNSASPLTLTVTGSPSVQAFSPFAPSGAYDPTVVGGSGYFDGTGDYLSVSQTAGNFGTSNWSIECWYCNTAAYSGTVYPRIISKSIVTANTSGAWGLGTRNGTTDEAWFSYNNGTAFTNVSTGFNVNDFAWHHLVATYDGTRIRVFVDGVLRQSAAPSISSFGTATGDSVLVGYQSRDGNYINGYVSNIRITNGSIPTSYQTSSTTNGTSIFTPPTAPLTTTSQGASNTSLLLNFTNAGITDATAKNDLETVGNAQISTTQSKFGGSSMSFDGTGDYLLIPHTVDQMLSTGNFTIELWVYRNSSGTYGLVGKGTGTTGWLVSLNSSNQVVFTYGSSTITSTGTVSATTWTYIAVVREGTGTNQTKIYINGSNDGTGTVSTDFNQTNAMYVGADRTGGSAFNGYIDDLRITRGQARTVTTTPTAAFPTQ